MTQNESPDTLRVDEAFFSQFFPFIHAADRPWFVYALGPYSARLNHVMDECRTQPTDGAYKDFIRHNVAYVYAFLPVWESQAAQAVLAQSAPLLLTPDEFRWLAQSSAAQALRNLCQGKFHPNIHERDRWELAQALAEVRTKEAMHAWATPPAPVIASVEHPLMQHVLGVGELNKGISSNSDILGADPDLARMVPMTAKRDLRRVHEDEALSAYFYAGSVLLLYWHKPINLSSVNLLAAGLVTLFRDRTMPIAVMSVVTPSAQASFESEARQLNVKLLQKYKHITTTAIAVIEGGGPRAALLRAATRLVKLAAPPWLTMEIRADVAIGCRWLAHHFTNIDESDLKNAVEQLSLRPERAGRVS